MTTYFPLLVISTRKMGKRRSSCIKFILMPRYRLPNSAEKQEIPVGCPSVSALCSTNYYIRSYRMQVLPSTYSLNVIRNSVSCHLNDFQEAAPAAVQQPSMKKSRCMIHRRDGGSHIGRLLLRNTFAGRRPYGRGSRFPLRLL